MDEILNNKLVSALEECRAHAKRLEYVIPLIADLFPLSSTSMKSLSDERIGQIDQFIYRFSKLQDSMGLRLFPAIFAYTEARAEPIPFIDMLFKLEQNGIILSAEDWQYFRNLRNLFAHEYPERPDEIVQSLNELFSSWDRFLEMYNFVRMKTEARLHQAR